jgi:hypothetical protein
MEYLNEITLTPGQTEAILKEHFQKVLSKLEPPGRVISVEFKAKTTTHGDQRDPWTETHLSEVKIKTALVVA